jgi:hypothetical protein
MDSLAADREAADISAGQADTRDGPAAKPAHGPVRILLALLTLVAALLLFARLPSAAPATLAAGFVSAWVLGAVATISVLAMSGKKRR